jgi:hypothetical protein
MKAEEECYSTLDYRENVSSSDRSLNYQISAQAPAVRTRKQERQESCGRECGPGGVASERADLLVSCHWLQ